MSLISRGTFWGLTLLSAVALVWGAGPRPAQANNCNAPAQYATPIQGIAFEDDDIAAVLVGDRTCRVYLYSLADNGNLVKTNSYRLVGDTVRVTGIIYLNPSASQQAFVRVHFPGTDVTAWLPVASIRAVD
jgi:hypothetical protein